jgi:predicted RNA binding protein with dsRBD fold (UPF0201 family)
MIPDIDCRIEVHCEVKPTEDPLKVQQAISNVLDSIELKTRQGAMTAISKDISSLAKIHQTIQNHRSYRIYARFLGNNLEGDTTWFYLNKQAAFANIISLCEHANESPLGPIKIVIHSQNIERLIEWLTSL